MTRGRWIVALPVGLLLARLLVACGTSSPPLGGVPDAADAGDDSGWVIGDTGPGIDYPDSIAGRVAERLGGCSGVEPGCHGGGAPSGLVLGRTPAQDFAQIIGVPSVERPDLHRIEPGDPSRSWLYLKVAGDLEAGVTTPMPLGTNGDPAFAALLRTWITAGAPNPFGDAGP